MGLTSCCILQPGGNSYRARGLNNFNPLLKLIYFHNYKFNFNKHGYQYSSVSEANANNKSCYGVKRLWSSS